MKKLLSIIIIIAMFAGVGLFITACNGDDEPEMYTVTIHTDAHVASLTVMFGSTAVSNGTQYAEGTVLVIDWTMQSGFTGVLHINGALAATAGPYSHTITGPTHIAIILTDTPYELITTAAQFAAIADNLDGIFRLGANLTLNNWTPVGTPEAPFTGELFANLLPNGQPEFTITSLSISNAALTDNIYFASLIGVNEGTIRNIVINSLNIDITVITPTPVNAFVYAVGIAGLSYGTITNSRVIDGDIDIMVSGLARIRAGMLAGEINGENAIIEGGAAGGVITANGEGGVGRAGGLVGVVLGGASVIRSRADVDITYNTLTGNASAAGLIGHTDRGAIVRQSFATGDILTVSAGSSTVYAGGLTGNTDAENQFDDENDRWVFEFTDVFATGNAEAKTAGNAYVSGLIARIANGNSNNNNPYNGANILVRNAYSTGNATSVIDITGGNHFVGGIVGRIQSVAPSYIRVQNVFATGNITVGTSEGDQFAGDIVGRSQNNGTRQVNNAWRAEEMVVTGNIRTTGGGAGELDGLVAEEAGRTVMLTAAWQQANLEWDTNIWTFANGRFPLLAWSV